MLKKLSVENKFTLQGIIIAGLLGVISCFLGFIFLFVFKLYSNSQDLNATVLKLGYEVRNQSVAQTAIMNKDIEQDKNIEYLQYADKAITDKIDTLKISMTDYQNGFINLEGRVYKLEKYHESN